MVSTDDMNKELRVIQDRKTAVAREIEATERRKRDLEQEASDLLVTERTLARLLSVDLPESTEQVADHRPDVALRKKPKGIPSVYIMAATILRESNDQEERRWLESQDIVQRIRGRWWPNAQSTDITPTLWRLSKSDKLIKDGSKYALPATDMVMSAPATNVVSSLSLVPNIVALPK